MHKQLERAKIFKPFDALKGLKEALEKEEIIFYNKKELSEDLFEELNDKMKNIKIGDNIIIKYYNNLEYIETKGIVRKIDDIKKEIYLLNSIIKIDDIIDITF